MRMKEEEMRTRVAFVLGTAAVALAVILGGAARDGASEDPPVPVKTLKKGNPITYAQFKEPFPVPRPSHPGQVIGGPTEVIGEY